jgi:SprT-like family
MAMNNRTAPRSNAELLDWLRPLFQEFNTQFFGGELPTYEVRVELLINGKTIIRLRNGKYRQLPPLGNDLYGLCLAEDRLIFIDSRCSALEDEGVREVLLHEMCHAAVCRNAPAPRDGDPHGQGFIAELLRLAALGEAWAGEEAQYYRTVSPGQQSKVPLDAWRAARK